MVNEISIFIYVNKLRRKIMMLIIKDINNQSRRMDLRRRTSRH